MFRTNVSPIQWKICDWWVFKYTYKCRRIEVPTYIFLKKIHAMTEDLSELAWNDSCVKRTVSVHCAGACVKWKISRHWWCLKLHWKVLQSDSLKGFTAKLCCCHIDVIRRWATLKICGMYIIVLCLLCLFWHVCSHVPVLLPVLARTVL